MKSGQWIRTNIFLRIFPSSSQVSNSVHIPKFISIFSQIAFSWKKFWKSRLPWSSYKFSLFALSRRRTHQHPEGNVWVAGTQCPSEADSHLEVTDFVWSSRLTHRLGQVQTFKRPVNYRLQRIWTASDTKQFILADSEPLNQKKQTYNTQK